MVFRILRSLFLLSVINPIFAEEHKVQVEINKIETGYQVTASNSMLIPAFVKISFDKLKNLKATVVIPYSAIIPAHSKKITLFQLNKIDDQKGYSYSYRTSSSKGDPNIKEDKNHPYLIPYKHGSKHRVAQAFHGEYTHFGSNAYAVDFEMPIGTAIYAARSGTVIDVVDQHNIGGPDPKYAKYGNQVVVFHSDGTFAYYVHLKHGGAAVKYGQEIKEGDLIGYSGNTGQSKGPHLHFEIDKATIEGSQQSIPFKFTNHNQILETPTTGKYYYSTHPGKPTFETIFGKDLTNDDYKGYSKTIEKTGKIEQRSETVDRTTVIYMRNGTTRKIEITVELTLKNVIVTTKNPVKFIVPALTEIFMLLLRPENSSEPFGYSSQMSYIPVD